MQLAQLFAEFKKQWRDRIAKLSLSKKKELIAREIILKEYTNRIVRQSMRLTGNQSLIESHQHTEQKGVIDSLKALFEGGLKR